MSDVDASSSRVIAIVGSLGADRKFEADKDLDEKNRQIAHDFGFALAEKGYRIAVYTNFKYLVELHLVRGYLSSPKAKEKSVRVITTADVNYKFSKEGEHGEPYDEKYFDRELDINADWIVPYFTSVGQADGILMIGGQTKTRIIGVLALHNGWPILALKDTGGSAKETWENIKASPAFAAKDANLMGIEYRSDLMDQYIDVLTRQIDAREKARAEEKAKQDEDQAKIKAYLEQNEYTSQTLRRSISIACLLAGLGASYWLVLNQPQIDETNPLATGWMPILLLLSALIAGALGGVVKTIFDHRADFTYRPSDNEWSVMALSGVAGMVCGMIYVASQIMAGATKVSVIGILAIFVGFVGGMTAEKVLTDLSKKNALDAASLTDEVLHKNSKPKPKPNGSGKQGDSA